MVLKAEMQSREAESSNFYSSPLIQAEKDKKVVNLRHSCPVTQAEGAKTFVTGVVYEKRDLYLCDLHPLQFGGDACPKMQDFSGSL